MHNSKLRIGKIPYANLFPIFYVLEKECGCSEYEFIEGPPSLLNRMLREGEIDVSPSSSIEYLKYPSAYRIIENHSISSKGAVGSILFFTETPLEELKCGEIYVSSQSETSVALLDIILREFYGIQCKLKSSVTPEKSGCPFMLIGDDALRYDKALREASGRLRDSKFKKPQRLLLSYDLGEIWHKKTGLPFVFALWIGRKEVFGTGDYRKPLIDRFVKDLNAAKKIALKSLPEIAKHSPLKAFLSEKEILSYWKRLDYELDAEHKKGLELFNQFIKES